MIFIMIIIIFLYSLMANNYKHLGNQFFMRISNNTTKQIGKSPDADFSENHFHKADWKELDRLVEAV